MNKIGILSVAVLLAGTLSHAATSTNFLADFEGSAVGTVGSSSVMNDGTSFGSWDASDWAGFTSAIITNSANDNRAFEFNPDITDSGSWQSVTGALSSVTSVGGGTNKIEVSFDFAQVLRAHEPHKSKAVFIEGLDSDGKYLFGFKTSATDLSNTSNSNAHRTLRWRDDQTKGGDIVTEGNAIVTSDTGLWNSNSTIKVLLESDSASLYIDDVLITNGLPYISGSTSDLASVLIRSNTQGAQVDNFLITHTILTATTNGTPIAWLQALGYTENFNAADSEDLDNDGLLNHEEYPLGTEGDNPDTDNDGFSDGVEQESGASPVNDNSDVYDAMISMPHLYGLYTSNSVMDVAFGSTTTSVSNDILLVEVQMLGSTNLATDGWSDLGSPLEFQDETTNSARFYRFNATP